MVVARCKGKCLRICFSSLEGGSGEAAGHCCVKFFLFAILASPFELNALLGSQGTIAGAVFCFSPIPFILSHRIPAGSFVIFPENGFPFFRGEDGSKGASKLQRTSAVGALESRFKDLFLGLTRSSRVHEFSAHSLA